METSTYGSGSIETYHRNMTRRWVLTYFEETVIESDGIKLKHFALYHDITDETIAEAKRVARKRVVLKDHFRSSRFEKHNFYVYKKKKC